MIPGFSLMSFACALEPLRAANRLTHQNIYEWVLLSPDGGVVEASNGIGMVPDFGIGDMPILDMLFVCAGINGQLFKDAKTIQSLKLYARGGAALGAISSGPHILARAGLLNGYRCTIHWEDRASFAEDFPNIRVTDNLYEVDRGRYTCAGGVAAMDMMLSIISQSHGNELAVKVSDQFILDHIRSNTERQQSVLDQFWQAKSTKLETAIKQMESHIEDPLALEQIAEIIGITVRHLIRLFQKHLQKTPAQFYLEIRLNHAKHLLEKTSMSVTQIAIASGFASAKHFSSCYKSLFGSTPAAQRRIKSLGN